MKKDLAGFDSKLVYAGIRWDEHGSVVTPIYQTSTFLFDNADQGADLFAGRKTGYVYTRLGNPTINALEECVAALEQGAGAVATSSGMGAVSTAYLALLESGNHVVSTASGYGPSRTLMETHLSKFGLASTYMDTSDLDAVRRAMRPETRMVYIETPSNPMMQITDIAAAAELAHANGARLVVDSTFASPYLQQPIGMTAVNALLPTDANKLDDREASDFLAEKAAGKSLAIIGHFPFADRLRPITRKLWVIELNPLPGDLSVVEGWKVLPESEVVCVTGATLINHTFDEIISACRGAYVVLVGPSAPVSPRIFEFGVDAICGARVVEPGPVIDKVMQSCREQRSGRRGGRE
jgi:uncharacterized protein (DUF4213/DUF364 family)